MMSGINQHYLPQFLMRGFAMKGGTEKSPVFKAVEHHKSRGVMPPRNIKGIGAQRNFYGKEGPGSVDDAIDRLENTLAPVVHRLNLGGPLTVEHIPQIASLAAHLVTRAKRMRSFMEEAFREGGELIRSYAKGDHLFELGARQIDEAQIEQMIVDEATKHHVVVTPQMMRLLKGRMREGIQRKKSDPALNNELASLLESAADQFDIEALDRSEQLHLRVLGQGLDPAARVAMFQGLNWSVVHFQDEMLILPDVPVIAFSAEGKGVSATVYKDDPPARVILPISTDRALMGSLTEGRIPTVNDINRVGAEFSHEFFIAERATEITRSLVTLIGAAPRIFDDPEWTLLKQEALERV